MKIFVIDVSHEEDEFWEEFRSFFNENLYYMVKRESLSDPQPIAILEDRWGWDFIFKVGDKVYAPDRNAGITDVGLHSEEFISFLKKEGDEQEFSPVWEKRLKSYS